MRSDLHAAQPELTIQPSGLIFFHQVPRNSIQMDGGLSVPVFLLSTLSSHRGIWPAPVADGKGGVRYDRIFHEQVM